MLLHFQYQEELFQYVLVLNKYINRDKKKYNRIITLSFYFFQRE